MYSCSRSLLVLEEGAELLVELCDGVAHPIVAAPLGRDHRRVVALEDHLSRTRKSGPSEGVRAVQRLSVGRK